MRALNTSMAALAAALLVAGCGGGDGGGPAGVQISNPARGQLMQNPPPRIAALSAAEFRGELMASATGTQLLQLATGSTTGTLPCGIDVQYIKYGTVGGANETTTATGALMVPTGTNTLCTDPHPIVVYAHGTNITKRYNLADLTDTTNPAYSEAVLLAALYAAQGYIVVAPNYAGYDASTLPYHPYVNGDQQSKDMIDALAAAKSALPNLLTPTLATSRLFLTGYSQGGYVAMATHKALQTAGVTVTAAAPMSGPYALGAYVDAIFGGTVPIGATAFAPLLVNSYKNSYPTVTFYNALTDVYRSAYASGIDTLVPGNYDFTTVFSSGKLPVTALFSATAPMSASTPFGFDPSNYLITDSFRTAYLTDAAAHPDGAVPTPTNYFPSATATTPLRIKLAANDMRSFVPQAPVLLCGGYNDPTVFYPVNTTVMSALWAAQSVPNWQVLNLESTSCTSNCAAGTDASTSTFAASAVLNPKFLAAKNAVISQATGANLDPTTEVAKVYHGTLVPPYCNLAAKIFFDAHL